MTGPATPLPVPGLAPGERLLPREDREVRLLTDALIAGGPAAIAAGLGTLVFRACRPIADPFGRPAPLDLRDIVAVRRFFGRVSLQGQSGARLHRTPLREALAVALPIEDRMGP